MSVKAEPPSRALLVVTLAVVVAFTVLRFITAATLDLRTDEAYYWTWAGQYVLGYVDHPPMVASVERLGIAIFGNTPLGVRFGQLLLLPLIELILADIARRRTYSWNAALFVVLALETTVNYGFFSIVVEPNLPLLFFASAMVWSLSRLDETHDPRWWLAVGAAAGLAALSKLLIILLTPAVLAFALFPGVRSLATPWPYAGAAIALAIFSPFLIWNAQHDWASFAYQSARLSGGEGNNLLRYALYETLLVGPVLLVAVLAGAIVAFVRGVRSGQAFTVALSIAVLAPLAYFAARSFDTYINQSWSWLIWPFGVLVLAVMLPPRRIVAAALVIAALGLPLPAAFFYHANFDRSVWFGAGDPLGQDAGYDDAAQRVLALARSSDATWVATSEYRLYSALSWHIGADIPVVMLTERVRFVDFAPLDPVPAGSALYVRSGVADPLLADAALTPVDQIPVMWRGEQMRTLKVDLLENFVPDLSPPPGSPFYVAAP